MTLTKSLLLIDYRGITFNDPPFRNSLEYFVKEGYKVTVILSADGNGISADPIDNCNVIRYDKIISWLPHNIFKKALAACLFTASVKWLTFFKRFDIILTVMLHPLAAININKSRSFLISTILDIPPSNSGRIDNIFNKSGWKRVKQANLIWCSDKYKAEEVFKRTKPANYPIVVHNCPELNYFDDKDLNDRSFLRKYLVGINKNIDFFNGSVLLRAGAVGEFGGIEQTIEAMVDLPENYVFVVMGRPSPQYKKHILSVVDKFNMDHRFALIDRADDKLWKQYLKGADIGHLIHLRPTDPQFASAFDLNSSLSNNRLFQYMAAGIPIISYADERMRALYNEVGCFAVVEPDNLTNQIRAAWLELGNNDSIRIRMGQAGREAHLTKYNWQAQFYPVTQRIGFSPKL